MYALARAIRPETVIEFGTSFGISTIYLAAAAAVADNGTGRVVTTELNDKKAKAAQANLQQAGVDAAVTILAGDARQTLADLSGPVGLVLLDGWKDLCLPVLRLLEPKLAPGALVAADDNDHSGIADYLQYVRDPAKGVRERVLSHRRRRGNQLLDRTLDVADNAPAGSGQAKLDLVPAPFGRARHHDGAVHGLADPQGCWHRSGAAPGRPGLDGVVGTHRSRQ